MQNNETYRRITAEVINVREFDSMRWFWAYSEARWLYYESQKSMARMLLTGIRPIEQYTDAELEATITEAYYDTCSDLPESEQPTPEEWVGWALGEGAA